MRLPLALEIVIDACPTHIGGEYEVSATALLGFLYAFALQCEYFPISVRMKIMLFFYIENSY